MFQQANWNSVGTVRTTGILLGGDQLMYGALKDSSGTRTNVDAGGCYYAS